MKKAEISIFAIARKYVEDWMPYLTDDDVNSMTCYIRNKDIAGFVNYTQRRASECQDAQTYRLFAQAAALMSKNSSVSDEETCFENAKKSFFRAEKLCRITNKRLEHYFFYSDRLDVEIRGWLQSMIEEIRTLVGPLRFMTGDVLSHLHLTSGASLNLARAVAMPYLKLRRRMTCTRRLVPFAVELALSQGYEVEPIAVPGNRVTLVPKNYRTHRTIACEPEWNLPLQLACDSYLKDRLQKFWKIDLRYGQATQQELARAGSVDGSLATVDFSMASDTLSKALVAILFPPEWYSYLTTLRSPRYKGPFGEGVYEKFSSMGNGTTFTLETIIFAAAAKAVRSKVVSVYGDDVIIDADKWDAFRKLTKFLGFIPNVDKTHHTGPFRESCGADWYLGTNVRPVYFKSIPSQKGPLGPICHLVNMLVHIGVPHGKLWELARSITIERDLPLVPFSETTTNGVHIPIKDAYDRRLIACAYDHLAVRQVCELQRTETKSRSWKSYTLWHVKKASQKGEGVCSSSEVPRGQLRSVVNWGLWHAPVIPTPLMLYAWAGFLPPSAKHGKHRGSLRRFFADMVTPKKSDPSELPW